MKKYAYKKSYHPLVTFFFYADMLDEKYLNLIPPTTMDYWKKIDHTALYGFDWVKDFYEDYSYYNSNVKNSLIFQSMRKCAKIINCFTNCFSSVKGYNRMLKNNVSNVIETIDYLCKDFSLKKACQVFGISSNQYYRWKNKIHCSASVLNLCFKSHPHQLTIAEACTVKDAVNNPEYYHFLVLVYITRFSILKNYFAA